MESVMITWRFALDCGRLANRRLKTMRRNVESLESFDQALQRIRLIKGITNFETSLLLSKHKI